MDNNMKILLIQETLYNEIQHLLKEEVDYNAFKTQDTLNPVIFDKEGVINPEVRKRLIQASKDYYEFLQIDDVKIIDIILAGSMANYNWSPYSDVDVHLVINFKDIGEDSDIVDNMMWALKEKWNLDHNIKMKDYDVEMYTQDINGDLKSNGIYSLVKNKWLKKPKKEEISVDKEGIQKIVNEYEDRYSDLLTRFKKGDNCNGLVEAFDSLIEDLFDTRKEALKQGGEFSTGNLAFKALRRDGFVDKIFKARNDVYDYTLSLNAPKTDLENKEEAIRHKKSAMAKGKDGKEESGETEAQYKINGKKYKSLRTASAELGVPHTTIQYRVNSDNPQWSAYQKI